MPGILLTHTPEMLRNYYGERAVAALRALGEIRFHDRDETLAGDALTEAARGCDIVVSDRQTARPRISSPRLPTSRRSCVARSISATSMSPLPVRQEFW